MNYFALFLWCGLFFLKRCVFSAADRVVRGPLILLPLGIQPMHNAPSWVCVELVNRMGYHGHGWEMIKFINREIQVDEPLKKVREIQSRDFPSGLEGANSTSWIGSQSGNGLYKLRLALYCKPARKRGPQYYNCKELNSANNQWAMANILILLWDCEQNTLWIMPRSLTYVTVTDSIVLNCQFVVIYFSNRKLIHSVFHVKM